MLFAPFFGSVVIPARVKAILVLALTLLLYPSIGQSIGTHPMAQWPLLVFMEFLIASAWASQPTSSSRRSR
jgi:flagellar biosynthetic protein FliR